MGPINLMKYICVTELIHLNFGKSQTFLFGIQGGIPGLHYWSFHSDSFCPKCSRGPWHLASIVRPITNLHSSKLPKLDSVEVVPICVYPLERLYFFFHIKNVTISIKKTGVTCNAFIMSIMSYFLSLFDVSFGRKMFSVWFAPSWLVQACWR